MELSIASLVKIVIAFVLVIAGLSLISVGWLIRLRIVAAMAVGIIFLGFLGWPLVKPEEPSAVVSVVRGFISATDIIIILVLAYIAGFCAYFVCTPYGDYIAPLAVPSGLAVWAMSRDDVSSLLSINHTLQERVGIYGRMRLEGFLWLAIVSAGYAGVATASALSRRPRLAEEGARSGSLQKNRIITNILALIVSGVIGHFAITVFVQDVRTFDSQLGSVVGQPSVAQTAFGVFVSFAIAAFVVKRFLNVSYIWPAASSALLVYFAAVMFAKPDVSAYMAENWPVRFFTASICAILPIQLVSFASLGSMGGYWAAIKYAQWRKTAAS